MAQRPLIGPGRPTYLVVDLDALAANVAVVRQALAPACRLMAVVKADGYGHGAVPAARMALAAGADALGVALAEEGRELRLAGITAPILVLGATTAAQVPLVVEHRLAATIFDEVVPRWLSERAAAVGTTVEVHLKVDTGMGRLGVPVDDHLADLAERVARLPHIELTGLVSHLADADHQDAGYTIRQYECFLKAADALRRRGLEVPVCHLANSAGALRFPGLQMDMVRVGIALYGLSPYPGAPRLAPVMSLHTHVVMAKRVSAGFPVGYGHSYLTPGPLVLATLPIGYADGYRRGLSNRAAALFRGQRVPVVGRVSMDQMVVAVDVAGGAEPGEEVTLLGRQGRDAITADEWAAWLDTIHYEVVTGFTSRVPRLYRRGGEVFGREAIDDQFLEIL